MGLFDRPTFDSGLDIEFPGFEGNPFEITWQTKTGPFRPMMDTYRVTGAGRLLKENIVCEVLPRGGAAIPQ